MNYDNPTCAECNQNADAWVWDDNEIVCNYCYGDW